MNSQAEPVDWSLCGNGVKDKASTFPPTLALPTKRALRVLLTEAAQWRVLPTSCMDMTCVHQGWGAEKNTQHLLSASCMGVSVNAHGAIEEEQY